MYIVVSLEISNTEDFWTSAQRNFPKLPESGVKRIVSVFPNQTMDKCTCLWEADSMESLDEYLREKIGNCSKESYYQVNEAAAVGLEG
jgi:hypothetical protein